jgi:hypothetical protein
LLLGHQGVTFELLLGKAYGVVDSVPSIDLIITYMAPSSNGSLGIIGQMDFIQEIAGSIPLGATKAIQ